MSSIAVMLSASGRTSLEIKNLPELALTNATPWETAIDIFYTELMKDQK